MNFENQEMAFSGVNQIFAVKMLILQNPGPCSIGGGLEHKGKKQSQNT